MDNALGLGIIERAPNPVSPRLAKWRGQSIMPGTDAGVAQLVEHDVANVVVDGSNPFARFSF